MLIHTRPLNRLDPNQVRELILLRHSFKQHSIYSSAVSHFREGLQTAGYSHHRG